MKKKVLIMALAAVLLVAVGVGGTLAWLTDSKTVTNTFTVGKIQMTLLEKNVDNDPAGVDRDTSNSYKIIPGTTVEKDPEVTIIEGSEKCYVFVQIVDELNDTVPGCATYTVNAAWQEIAHDSNIYVYCGTGSLTPAEVDASAANKPLPKVFESVTFNGDVLDAAKLSSLEDKTIKVDAYAHQSANLEYDATDPAATDVLGNAIAYFNNLNSTTP